MNLLVKIRSLDFFGLNLIFHFETKKIIFKRSLFIWSAVSDGSVPEAKWAKITIMIFDSTRLNIIKTKVLVAHQLRNCPH